MEGVSYWYLDNVAGIPAIPQKVVANIKDWQSWDPLSTKNAGGPRGLVGSGPFMLKSYKPGEYVMMKRNPLIFTFIQLFKMKIRGLQ